MAGGWYNSQHPRTVSGPFAPNSDRGGRTREEQTETGLDVVEVLPATCLWQQPSREGKAGPLHTASSTSDHSEFQMDARFPSSGAPHPAHGWSTARAMPSTSTGPPSYDELTPVLSIPSTASWHLVWVQERCYKEDSLTFKAALSEAVASRNGAFSCFKKAVKYEKFLSVEIGEQPYILLTDWREVKPCFEVLKRFPSKLHPEYTVVLCPLQKQFENASEWVRTQDTNKVCISRDLYDCEAFAESAAGALAPWQTPQHPQSDSPAASDSQLHPPGDLTVQWPLEASLHQGPAIRAGQREAQHGNSVPLLHLLERQLLAQLQEQQQQRQQLTSGQLGQHHSVRHLSDGLRVQPHESRLLSMLLGGR